MVNQQPLPIPKPNGSNVELLLNSGLIDTGTMIGYERIQLDSSTPSRLKIVTESWLQEAARYCVILAQVNNVSAPTTGIIAYTFEADVTQIAETNSLGAPEFMYRYGMPLCHLGVAEIRGLVNMIGFSAIASDTNDTYFLKVHYYG